MAIGATAGEQNDSAHRELKISEFVALGLLAVEGFVILGYVAAAIANQAQYGGQPLSPIGPHVWGYTLSLAAGWSAPALVAVFLLGPLALVAWIGRRSGDEVSGDRIRLVLRLALALAVLTVVGGILSIVGHVMQNSPSQAWNAFFFTLGNAIGSVVLGALGIVVVRWLAGDMRVDLFGRDDGGGFAEGLEDQ